MSLKFSDIIKQYSGDGDFSEWLEKLELVANLQGVKELEKFLPLFLSGGAFAVYQSLPDETKNDYDSVKKDLLRAFSSDQFNAFEQLSARQLLPGESVDVFLADINRLARLVNANGENEQWVKCAFICGLPDSVKAQLRAACSIGTLSLAAVVDRCRTLIKSNEICMVGNVRKTPQIICYACGEPGHVRRDCKSVRNLSKPKIVSSGSRRCFVCGETSHLASACAHKFGAGTSPASKNE